MADASPQTAGTDSGDEQDLVAHLQRRVRRDSRVVLGIGDDAALLRMPPNQLLVVSTDTLVSGVHFPADTALADIGWKALAVNLSDLAAMGATPLWASLSLALPQVSREWIDPFLDGFLALAAEHGVVLVGGDLSRAPLPVITVTIHGAVPSEYALRRSGGRVRDDVWLSGRTGEAAAALACADAPASVAARLNRPTPRLALGVALREYATAALDVSDGVLLDAQRLCRASGCAAELWLDQLPRAAELAALADGDVDRVEDWMLAGGDDYELLFTAVPEAREDLAALSARLGLPLTRIGRCVAGVGEVTVLRADGSVRPHGRMGWQHTP